MYQEILRHYNVVHITSYIYFTNNVIIIFFIIFESTVVYTHWIQGQKYFMLNARYAQIFFELVQLH